MSSRFLTILLFLVLTAAVAACEPAPAVTDIDPKAEIQTAVEEIATAIAEEAETPTPPTIAQLATPEFVTQTPAVIVPETGDTWTPIPTPTPAATATPTDVPIPTPTDPPTPTLTDPPAPTLPAPPTEVTPAAPTATPTPFIPETGVLPTPTPELTPIDPDAVAGEIRVGFPPEIAAEVIGWPMANRDYGNSRTAVGGDIFADNVHTLGIAWSFDLPQINPQFAPAGSPLILEGVVYYQDLQSSVYALDLLTGELVWQQEYNQPVYGPAGPAIGYGKVYVQVGSSLRALSLFTGEELWITELDGMGGSHQPYVFDEKVFTSTRQIDPELDGDEQARSGWFYAIHQESGEILWQQPAVEKDVWGDTEINKRGGSWFSPAIDPQRGASYWGTGKLVQMPGENGLQPLSGPENGNVFAHSVISLSLETGNLTWAAQLDPAPRYGHGIELPPLLITLERDEEGALDMVVGAGRAGRIMTLERGSGEIIWQTQVGWQQNIHLETLPAGRTIQIFPGLYGGIISPMAYADGTIYAAVNEFPVDYVQESLQAEEEDMPRIPPLPTPPTEALLDGRSHLLAIDAATGAVLWTVDLPRMNFGGITVVNDLLFTTTIDGAVYAFIRETGENVWAAQAPEGLLSPAAISGETLVLAAFGGEQPFLFALRLGQASPPPVPAAPATPTPTVTPTPTPTITPETPLPPPAVTPTPTETPSPTPDETDPEEPTPLPTLPTPDPEE
jgi:alcohol dehydrogenase (cytochrome c)